MPAVVPDEAGVEKEEGGTARREPNTCPSRGCNSNRNTQEAMTHSGQRSQ